MKEQLQSIEALRKFPLLITHRFYIITKDLDLGKGIYYYFKKTPTSSSIIKEALK